MTESRFIFFKIALATALLWLVSAWAAYAEPVIDVSRLTSSLRVTTTLRNVVTGDERVTVELPMGDGNKPLTMQLDAEPGTLPYHWQILTLINKGNAPKKLILTLDHQKFDGSKIIDPRTPGSIISGIAVNAGTSLNVLQATGEDDFELELPPQATMAIAFQLSSEMTTATLWHKSAFDFYLSSITFLRGAILGISLLMFAAMMSLSSSRRRNSLPIMAGGALATSSLGFIALEEGYQNKISEIFGSMPLSGAEARGIIEVMMTVSIAFCLSALLDPRRRDQRIWSLFLTTLIIGAFLAAYSFVNSYFVTSLARIAFGLIAITGFILLFIKSRKNHQMVGLVPWSALLVWTFFAGILAISEGTPSYLSYVLMAGLLVFLVLICYHLSVESELKSQLAPHRPETDRRALALSAAQLSVWEWIPHDNHLYLSDELRKTLGYPPENPHIPVAEQFLEIMHPLDRNAYTATLESARRRGRGQILRDFRLARADGTYRWFELKARVVPQQPHSPLRMIGAMADITHYKISQERLIDNAIYDRITGLPNRALFIDRLEREIPRHSVDSLYVLLIDLDRFKSLNDGLGAETGDALLTIVGRRLTSIMDPMDTLARLPGDQFAILISQPEQRGLVIESFAHEVLAKISSPIIVGHHEIFLTACIGIAVGRYLGMTAPALMKEAAIALYEAKRQGKETTVIFNVSMQDKRGELVALESELQRALERNEIEVHYQPIARLSDMDLAGFEALVRWRHPTLGLLSPGSFLNLAEQSGLIKDIGQFVLNEAVRQLGIWQRSFRPADPVFMAVNISASQLLDTDVVTDLTNALTREAVYRQSVKIEVTESVVMQFPEKSASLLHRIKQQGVGLACDDFGTGFSSLSSLRDLPFDTLKIDRSFIEPEAEGERAAIILSSIITMAHHLNMTIVVEGIESQLQVDRMGAMGVDLGQGFFIGQPMTARQITDALIASSYNSTADSNTIASLWERSSHDPMMRPADIPLNSAMLASVSSPNLEQIITRGHHFTAPPPPPPHIPSEPNVQPDEPIVAEAEVLITTPEIVIVVEEAEAQTLSEPEELPPLFSQAPPEEPDESDEEPAHPPHHTA